MKKTFILILFLSFSCKKVDKDEISGFKSNNKETFGLQKTKFLKEIRYVNTITRLNYRDKPNGEIIGKLENNDEVNIIEHTNFFSEIKDNSKLIKGEWVGISIEKDTVYVFDAFLSPTKINTGVWSKFPLRKQPLTDSTNFDSIKHRDKLNTNDIVELQLRELYPNLDRENYNYKFYPSYKLDFKNFNCIIVNVFKGDHELETVLIIYDLDNKIKLYNDDGELEIVSLMIAYDEIAEGWSRTTSKIKNNTITTINALYTDTPVIDTTLYHINTRGYINKVNTNFKNNIRYNNTIKLSTIYTDTIQFIAYNDDYDYFLLEGRKSSKTVSLIYNWDSNKEKYNFKKNDLIKINWKMDRIYIPSNNETSYIADNGETVYIGDGETLDFSEFVLDAEKIEE